MDNGVELPDYKQRRRFEAFPEPADLPVAELSPVRHAPVTVPRSVR
jgi:hypothetical protein